MAIECRQIEGEIVMGLLFVSIGLLGLLAAALTIHVGRVRGRKGIFLGDGGDKEMLTAIRAHANFIEFVPLCLILIITVRGPYGGLNAGILAAALLVSRLLHAAGMLGYIKGGRFAGTTGTLIILIVSSAAVILAGLGLKLY
jgi:uncharacterized membrane protein YecN with MAPEG domain